MNNRRLSSGFTLIELMITLIIIGVLLGAAIPSYLNSVKKTNRADAKIALLNTSQLLQKCYTVYGAFNNTNCPPQYKNLAAGTYPSDAGLYNIKISTNAGADPKTTYILTATAAKDPQTKDITACLKMTLNQKGDKGDANVSTNSTCW